MTARQPLMAVSVLAAVLLGMSSCSSAASARGGGGEPERRHGAAADALRGRARRRLRPDHQLSGGGPPLTAQLPGHCRRLDVRVTDDASPASHRIHGASVFDGAIAADRSAKTYAEAMPAPCAQQPAGRYAVKHNAWAYFADPAPHGNCQRFDVPTGTPTSGSLRSDIDTTVIAPNVVHVRNSAALTHYSLSGYLAELAATPPHGAVASAPSLRAAFGI